LLAPLGSDRTREKVARDAHGLPSSVCGHGPISYRSSISEQAAKPSNSPDRAACQNAKTSKALLRWRSRCRSSPMKPGKRLRIFVFFFFFWELPNGGAARQLEWLRAKGGPNAHGPRAGVFLRAVVALGLAESQIEHFQCVRAQRDAVYGCSVQIRLEKTASKVLSRDCIHQAWGRSGAGIGSQASSSIAPCLRFVAEASREGLTKIVRPSLRMSECRPSRFALIDGVGHFAEFDGASAASSRGGQTAETSLAPPRTISRACAAATESAEPFARFAYRNDQITGCRRRVFAAFAVPTCAM